MKREHEEDDNADPPFKTIKTETTVPPILPKHEPSTDIVQANEDHISNPEFIAVPGMPMQTYDTTPHQRSPVKSMLRPVGTSNIVVDHQPTLISLPEEFADAKLQVHLNKFVDCVEKTKKILDQAEILIKEGWVESEIIMPGLELPETDEELLEEKEEPDWVKVISTSLPQEPPSSSKVKLPQSKSKTDLPSQETIAINSTEPLIKVNNVSNGSTMEIGDKNKVESSKSISQTDNVTENKEICTGNNKSENVATKAENLQGTKKVPALAPLIISHKENEKSLEDMSSESTDQAPSYPETSLENGYEISLAEKRARNLIEQNNYEEVCKIYLELYNYQLKNIGINHINTREILMRLFYIFDNLEQKNCKYWLEFITIMQNRIIDSNVHQYDNIDILKCILTHVQSKWSWDVEKCSEFYKMYSQLIQNLEKTRGIEDELTLKAMLDFAKLLERCKPKLAFELYIELNIRYNKIEKDNTELLENMYCIVIENSKMLQKWSELMKESIENKHYKSIMKILKKCHKYKIKSQQNRKYILDIIRLLENKLKIYFGSVDPIVLHFILDKADLLFSWDKKNVMPVYKVVHETSIPLFGETDEITVNALLGNAECLWHMGEINKCLDIYDTLLKDALDKLGPFHMLRRVITKNTSEHHVLTKHLLQAKVEYLKEKHATLAEIEYIRMYARVMRPDTSNDVKIAEMLKDVMSRDVSFNTSMSLLVNIFNRIRELVFLS